MHKSTVTTVLLIAILFTGAIMTASTSVIDADAKEKKDKEKYYDKDDRKNKDKQYDDESYDYSKDYSNYEGKDKDKYDDYKDESHEYDSYTKEQKDYNDKYPENYKPSYDKHIKKIKIVDCTNRNINADGIQDYGDIKPTLDTALDLKNANDKLMQLDSFGDFNNNPKNSEVQVYSLPPDTKIIVKCSNENHYLSPVQSTNSETLVSDDNSSTSTENNAGQSLPSISNSVPNVTPNTTTEFESVPNVTPNTTTESESVPNVTPNTTTESESVPNLITDTPENTSEPPFLFPIPITIN
jgi:hypothetical protein